MLEKEELNEMSVVMIHNIKALSILSRKGKLGVIFGMIEYENSHDDTFRESIKKLLENKEAQDAYNKIIPKGFKII